ncbi:MAG TPA: hypothetical protein V6D47_17615 [Oscillatoriaceae cyanobacterium]
MLYYFEVLPDGLEWTFYMPTSGTHRTVANFHGAQGRPNINWYTSQDKALVYFSTVGLAWEVDILNGIVTRLPPPLQERISGYLFDDTGMPSYVIDQWRDSHVRLDTYQLREGGWKLKNVDIVTDVEPGTVAISRISMPRGGGQGRRRTTVFSVHCEKVVDSELSRRLDETSPEIGAGYWALVVTGVGEVYVRMTPGVNPDEAEYFPDREEMSHRCWPLVVRQGEKLVPFPGIPGAQCHMHSKDGWFLAHAEGNYLLFELVTGHDVLQKSTPYTMGFVP